MQHIIAGIVIAGIITGSILWKKCHKPQCKHAHHWATEQIPPWMIATLQQGTPARPPEPILSPLALLRQEPVPVPVKPRWQQELEEILHECWQAQEGEQQI